MNEAWKWAAVIIIIFQFASFYRFEDGLKNNKSPVTSQQENIHFIINYYVMRSCMYVDMEICSLKIIVRMNLSYKVYSAKQASNHAHDLIQRCEFLIVKSGEIRNRKNSLLSFQNTRVITLSSKLSRKNRPAVHTRWEHVRIIIQHNLL